jgi:exopolysaccharide biosynthesis polyprenyl glycosylphosphotransferase
LFGHNNGLYRGDLTKSVLEESMCVIRTLMAATLCLATFMYITRETQISRLVLGMSVVFSCAFMVGLRVIRSRGFAASAARSLAVRRVLIVGAGRYGRALASYFAHRSELGYEVRGFLDNNVAGPEILGTLTDIECVVRAEFIDEIFISVPSARELVKRVTTEAQRLQIDVKVLPEMYDGLAWSSPVEFVGELPVRVLHRVPMSSCGLFLKRFVDISAAGFGLIYLSPVLFAIAALIKLDSRGPVIYRAKRIGRKGEPFDCLKFRTMITNADELREKLAHLNERDGALFKITNDPRVTRLGRILRKYSLDELPQLWNVFRGEMSLVGPRPPMPEEVRDYHHTHLRRLDVTPGITGLWQVSARQDPSFETAVSLDTQYIENWSCWLDIKILLRTIAVVVRGTGT